MATEFSVTGLRVLSEVGARGSFTAAADALGYSQSAVSRQVAGLEQAAGTRLFERRPRGVALTESGATLLQHAGRVLDELEAARRDLARRAGDATRRLRVGAFPTAMASLLPRALAGMRVAQPGIEISLREGSSRSQLRRIVSGSADLAVVGVLPGASATRDRRVELEHLFDDPLLLAVAGSHPLARRRSVDIDELARERWIAASTDASDALLGAWQWAEWRPEVVHLAREWTAKLGLVAAGLGVTLVPGLAAEAVRADVGLVRIRSHSPSSRAVLIATRATGDQSAAKEFVQQLHEAAAEVPAALERRLGAARR